MTIKSKSKLPIELYGRRWPADTHPAQAALACFADGYEDKRAKLKRYDFFRIAAQTLLPSVLWWDPATGVQNSWLQSQVGSLCDDQYASKVGKTLRRTVVWTGAAAAGKTHAAGFFSYLWWAANPGRSSVTLTSTSKIALGQRVWPVIQRMHYDFRDPWSGQPRAPGHLVDSLKKVQASKGDDLHAIHALAVERGDLTRAVNGIKGRHCERMMLIVDEANTTPNAIFECVHNMSKGCLELVVLVIGNALSHLDNHGRCCEPATGWNSISINTGLWRTAGVPEWNIEPGVCVHYDGSLSPNVLAKRTVFPFLYTYEDYLRRRHNIKSAQHWSNERGFWPTEGMLFTVFTEPMLINHDARGTLTFDSWSTPVAGLDPGFTGDKCVARFGLMGDVEGKRSVLLTEEVELEVDPEASSEADFQVARQFIKACRERGVQPEHAGCDASGTGRGVYAILTEEWSSSVVRVEFGGKPSDMAASGDDGRPGHAVYDRKVTELWYSVRELLLSGQVKGFTVEDCIQFCSREFKLLPGGKVRLDTKEECKKKLGRSPDNADATVVLVHVARLSGLAAVSKRAESRTESWSKLATEVSAVAQTHYAEQPEFVSESDDEGSPDSFLLP